MSFSLNEVEATAKRASRGAGYHWGLAEEAAKATRWLCSQGLDGCKALANLLDGGFATEIFVHTPVELKLVWQSDGGLCALTSGAVLSDNAKMLDQQDIRLRNVPNPILLLPFAAQAARSLGSPVRLVANGWLAVTDGPNLSLSGEVGRSADEVIVSLGGEMEQVCDLKTRATPDMKDWVTLMKYGHKTFAPATEESRLLGAGAGLSDND